MPFSGKSRIVLPGLILFCAFMLVVSAPVPSSAAAPVSVSQLEKDLAREKKKAAERKQNLQRLTEQERTLNADLAAAEKRILELEKGLASQQTKLRELGGADNKLRIEYETLLAEQAKTEEAQAQALRLLWEATGKRIAVGSRDLPDWAETDREYAWSRELYASLEKYRKQLDQQEAKLAQVLGRRDKISRDVQSGMQTVNEEKSKLLKARIEYDKKLAELRRQRGSTEAELQNILKLVDSLNLEIAQRSKGDIASMKGKLPWPVSGKVRVRYAPQSDPASRGLGFSTADGAEVKAVAGGTVVHNDVLRGFGTVLILQHGEEYYSLYAFLGSSPLKVGQDVAGRQAIGTAGYYPAIKGSGLYFELRFKQKAINPEAWFAS
ncbi:MAG: peptidoglycan DD-metalloendopeptidase family protein [Desulfovibrionaceae bacterium]|nr:peptidoglycan DD-metalloendopeptidase family protein [Desulfovibrionaceae bacterium]